MNKIIFTISTLFTLCVAMAACSGRNIKEVSLMGFYEINQKFEVTEGPSSELILNLQNKENLDIKSIKIYDVNNSEYVEIDNLKQDENNKITIEVSLNEGMNLFTIEEISYENKINEIKTVDLDDVNKTVAIYYKPVLAN